MAITINGVSLSQGYSATASGLPAPAHKGVTMTLQDVDSASTGRNTQGKMIRDRVAQKVKINLKFPALSPNQLNALLSAVNNPSFTVTFPSFCGKTSAEMYVGDRTAPVYWELDGVPLYVDVAFNLIEL